MRCRDHARTILSAWRKGDQERVGTLLGQAPGGTSGISSDEEERRELLDGIIARLRSSPIGDPAAAVSLRLLRHLATAGN